MNILLMIADDLGRDLGCLGNAAIRSPRLDRLAAEGTLFTEAFASTASCSGSRSTIFTGRHTHATGAYGLHHDIHHFQTFATVPTAPRLFAEAGWRTGIIGKVHVGPDAVYPWGTRIERLDHRDVRLLADHARGFLAADGGRPFFLTVGFGDPHRAGDASGFANSRDYRGVDRRTYDPATVPVPAFLPDLPEVRAELAEYHQAVDRLDQGVGMVLDALDAAGVADDTLVIFVSDNGIPFINAKTTLYDAGIRLPLIVRRPGAARGVRNLDLVSFVDLLPTMLATAGIAPPPGLHGRDFSALIGTPGPASDRDRVFCSHTFHEVTNYWPTRVLRTRRWKYHKNVAWKLDFPFASDLYGSRTWQAVAARGDVAIGRRAIHDYINRPHEQLFDLSADPDEVVDRAGDAACATILSGLRADLERWQLRTQDPWLFRDGVSALHRLRDGHAAPPHHDMRWTGMAEPRRR